MILSKDFLKQALPYATFSVSGLSENKSFENDSFLCANQWVTAAVDSRIVESNEIFVALVGAKVDGHDYLDEALKRGACALIVNQGAVEKIKTIDSDLLKNKLIIVVPDTSNALADLAKAWRNRLNMPVVGITGSIGKTTTKEIVRSILKLANVPFYASHKNQNSFTGLCLNILRVEETNKVAVFEVGISELGEMAVKADILRPTIGLITCIAHSHGSGLGVLQDIANEKRQLFKNFKPNEVGIVFGDQLLLTDFHYSHPIAKFGLKTKNQVQARKINSINDENAGLKFILKWYGQKAEVVLKSNHMGMVNNTLAASTIAYFLDIPFEVIVDAVQNYLSFENRFEPKMLKGYLGRIISDCCNANPESMRAAIVAFDKIKSIGPKIAVLGDMLELGEKEHYWHRQIGRLLNKVSNVDSVILVGERAKAIADTAPGNIKIELAQDWQQAQEILEKMLLVENSLVLVKASAGMHLNKIVKNLTV